MILVILVIAWAIPGPVVELVARQETLLLGRYGVAHFVMLTLATLLLGLVAALLWNPALVRGGPSRDCRRADDGRSGGCAMRDGHLIVIRLG